MGFKIGKKKERKGRGKKKCGIYKKRWGGGQAPNYEMSMLWNAPRDLRGVPAAEEVLSFIRLTKALIWAGDRHKD